MGRKPKIEIIQIGLDNLDIAKEIRERTDTITVDTSRFADLKPVSEKKRIIARWESKIQKVVALLHDARLEERWLKADEVIAAVEIEPKQLGGFIGKLRKYLRGDDEWMLQKKQVKKKSTYMLVRFGAG